MSGGAEVTGSSGHRLDRVRLTGISATGYHGVFAHERREGQTFVADVVAHLDTRRAAATDDLAHTLHYGVLAEQVEAVLAGEPADLIETVAERIAATVLAYPQVQAVDVAVHKPQAPVTVPFDDVVVEIRRDRGWLPAAEPLRQEAAPTVVAAATVVAAPATEPAPGRVGSVPDDVPDVLPDDDAPDAGVEAGPVHDVLDLPPSEPVEVVLAIGANVGAAQETLRQAVADLAAIPGLTVTAVSALARTAPVGGPEQPDFLNAVLLARTTLTARDLLHATAAVEQAHGRQRTVHWGPRTLDVDLIVYGEVSAVTDDLELPHPRAHERAFVLQPWAQVQPDAVLHGLGGGPVAALAATAPDREGVRWLALDWLTAPTPWSGEEHAPVDGAAPVVPSAATAPAGPATTAWLPDPEEQPGGPAPVEVASTSATVPREHRWPGTDAPTGRQDP